MANEEQLAILKQGVEVWNKWREENLNTEIYLNGANLNKADLVLANLSYANLSFSDLSEAQLSSVDLEGSDLSGANLKSTVIIGADLSFVNFSEANLNGADLTNSDLGSVNFWGADLTGSNFATVEVHDTIFGHSDLSQILGIDDVRHYGPSSISTDTFALSKGKIPENFLRGCGLPDWEIEGTIPA